MRGEDSSAGGARRPITHRHQPPADISHTRGSESAETRVSGTFNIQLSSRREGRSPALLPVCLYVPASFVG